MYKPSTQKNHRPILHKDLVPRFGGTPVAEVTPHAIQEYVAALMDAGDAPKTIDHIHDVLSAVLRTAVKWGHLRENPAHKVDLPRLRPVRPKWALTISQARALLHALPPRAQTLVGLALLTGVRRGELFALRWRDVDHASPCLTIREAVYEGRYCIGHRSEAGGWTSQ